jgi:hypothetical protein
MVHTREHRCPDCGHHTEYKALSGGREWYCPENLGGCGANGGYPAEVLPCIVCGTELRQAITDSDDRQPSGGTVFRSYGNYGSTLYDPSPASAGRERLEVNVCDPCLRARFTRVLYVQTSEIVSENARMWFPPDMQIRIDEEEI